MKITILAQFASKFGTFFRKLYAIFNRSFQDGLEIYHVAASCII